MGQAVGSNSESVASIAEFKIKDFLNLGDLVRQRKEKKKKAMQMSHKKINLKRFDSQLFKKEILGTFDLQKEKTPIEIFKGLPLLNKKYKIIKTLGKGLFGYVLKCYYEKENMFYAVKCLIVEKNIDKKDIDVENMEQVLQKRVIQSMETEINILPQLKHKYGLFFVFLTFQVIEYIESFYPEKDPLRNKKIPIDESHYYCCIVMKFIRGADLDKIIEFGEQKKFVISPIVTMKWFYRLLEAIKYFHSKNIAHRDIKPDNILVEYITLEDIEKMELIITDFGVGKIATDSDEPKKTDFESDEDNTKSREDNVAGNLYFSAPEVFEKKGADLKYDLATDIWSVAIVFVQCYYGISTNNFHGLMKNLIGLIKKTPTLRKKFEEEMQKKCEGFILKAGASVDITDVLKFIHSSGLFYEKFVEFYSGNDKGMMNLFKSIFCQVEVRSSAEELLKNKIIRTWRYLFKDIDEDFRKEEIDLYAIFSVLRSVKDEGKLCLRIFKILTRLLEKQRNSLVTVIEEVSGIELICGKFLVFDGKKKIFQAFISLAKKLISIESLEKIFLFNLRDFLIVEYLMEKIEGGFSQETLDFVYTIIIKNKSILGKFGSCFPIFFRRFTMSGNKNETLRKILELMLQIIDFEKFSYEIVNQQKDVDLLLFNRITWQHFSDDSFSWILESVVSKISELLCTQQKDEGKIRDFVQLLVTLTYSKIKTEHNMQIDEEINTSNELEMKIENLENPNVKISSSEIHTAPIKNNPATFVISSFPLCFFKENKSKEDTVIGYMEVDIQNGGTNDLVEFGVNINKERSFFFNGSEGLIYTAEKEKKETKFKGRKKLCEYCEVFSNTKDIMGVGITSKKKIFFTKNNEIYPKVEIDLKDGDKIYGFFPISSKDYYNVKVNFGEQKNFYFNFRGQIAKKNINIEKKMKKKVISSVKKVKKVKFKEKNIETIVFLMCDHITRLLNQNDTKFDDNLLKYLKKSVNFVEYYE